MALRKTVGSVAVRISAGKPLSTGKRTRWYHGKRDKKKLIRSSNVQNNRHRDNSRIWDDGFP